MRIRAGFGQLSPQQRRRLIEAPHRLIWVPDLLTNQSNIERLRTTISQSDADLQLLGTSYALVGDAAVQIPTLPSSGKRTSPALYTGMENIPSFLGDASRQ